MGFPGGSDGKEPACNVGDLGSIPGLGKSPGERKGYPLQYSGLENSCTDCVVHGVTKSDMTERLSLSLLHCRQILYRLSHQGSSYVTVGPAQPCPSRLNLYASSVSCR